MVSSITTPAAATDNSVAVQRSSVSRQNALHDAALVRRFNQDGDESAFVEIVSRYREKTFTVAFAALRNRADADEIVQDTFIRAHRGLSTFRGDCSLATWMHRIALNLARNRYWYYFRRQQHTTTSLDCALTDDSTMTLANRVASREPGPVEETVISEYADLFTKYTARLTPSQSSILRQRSVDNCSYSEIATGLGISIGTVKSRIARARERLRALISEACPEFGTGSTPSEWLSPTRSSNFPSLLAA